MRSSSSTKEPCHAIEDTVLGSLSHGAAEATAPSAVPDDGSGMDMGRAVATAGARVADSLMWHLVVLLKRECERSLLPQLGRNIKGVSRFGL